MMKIIIQERIFSRENCQWAFHYDVWKARWSNGYYTGLWIKKSGFEPWLRSLHYVLAQDT